MPTGPGPTILGPGGPGPDFGQSMQVCCQIWVLSGGFELAFLPLELRLLAW